MIEIRCPAKLHGIIVSDGEFEVKCRSRFCGYRPGIVVLHRFSTDTGKLIKTLRFREPEPKKRENKE